MSGAMLRRVGRTAIAGAAIVAAFAFATACGGDSATAPPGTTGSIPAPPAATTVVVWFADGDARLRPQRVPVTPGADPLAVAMDALAAGPSDPALLPALPAGTRVIGATSDGMVATVDLSEAFEAGYPSGGAAAETAVIGPIVRTAAGASGAPLVRVLVEGRAPAPPGTQFDLSRPLAVGDLPRP